MLACAVSEVISIIFIVAAILEVCDYFEADPVPFIPVVQGFQSLNMNLQPLWWALLFGGCLGGNITLIGSTANIVAIGIIEKEKRIKISFLTWFWVGLAVGLVTTLIVMAALIFLPFYR